MAARQIVGGRRAHQMWSRFWGGRCRALLSRWHSAEREAHGRPPSRKEGWVLRNIWLAEEESIFDFSMEYLFNFDTIVHHPKVKLFETSLPVTFELPHPLEICNRVGHVNDNPYQIGNLPINLAPSL